MFIEAAQAAVAEVAKQGSVTIAIPTAFLSSAATLLLYKGVPFLVNTMRGKPKNRSGAVKPGMGEDCLKHRDKLIELETDRDHFKETMTRHEGYFQEILKRLPK